MTRVRGPADRDHWNEVGEAWRDGRDHLWRLHADAVNLALCRRWLRPVRAGRLLKTDLFDEATGRGLVGPLADCARRVMAVDRAETIVGGARARHGAIPAAVADVRLLPFTTGAFDAVISNSTLDHFEHEREIARSLEELHRVLAPGGRLVLTLDNGDHPVVALRNALPVHLLMRAGLVPYYVGRTLRAAPLTRLLNEIGFRPIETTAVLHCPRALVVPLARAVGRGGPSSAAARTLLRIAWLFERAERLPSRFRTGHFIAVLAERV